MVFATHTFAGSVIPPHLLPAPLVSVASVLGYVGVSCFFVLSGFVLTWSRRPDDTARRFWRRRVFKIYPNHLVTMLGLMLWMVASHIPIVGPIPNLLLLQAWTTDADVTFGIDVSWSLSVEMFFYLSFPMIFALIRRIRPEHLWYCVTTMVLLVFLVPATAAALPATPQLPWEPTSAPQFWFIYVFPVTRALEFIVGMLLAQIVSTGRWIPVPVWAAWAALGAGCVTATALPSHYQIVVATILPLSILIPTLAVSEIKGRPSLLANRAMVWLGNISFAFYLLHSVAVAIVLDGLHRLLGNGFSWTFWSATAVATGGLTLGILLSWMLFAIVEVPVQRRFSVSRRKSRADGGQPATSLPSSPGLDGAATEINMITVNVDKRATT
jgi:peptidoglycan/LPS O-acetylase OafA/YrhL